MFNKISPNTLFNPLLFTLNLLKSIRGLLHHAYHTFFASIRNATHCRQENIDPLILHCNPGRLTLSFHCWYSWTMLIGNGRNPREIRIFIRVVFVHDLMVYIRGSLQQIQRFASDHIILGTQSWWFLLLLCACGGCHGVVLDLPSIVTSL